MRLERQRAAADGPADDVTGIPFLLAGILGAGTGILSMLIDTLGV
jgi:hypothetical protein